MPAQRVWRGVSSKLAMPAAWAKAISTRAAELVRRRAPVGPKNSRQLVRPTWRPGEIGVHFPPAAAHLLMLDRGIRPFVMYSLEGKTIPMRGPDGSTSFRVAKDVGKPRITSRDSQGRILSSDIRWRYPGVAPMNFVAPAIQQATQEFFGAITPREMKGLLEQTQLGTLLSQLNSKGVR